jgi:hypothetical protein
MKSVASFFFFFHLRPVYIIYHSAADTANHIAVSHSPAADAAAEATKLSGAFLSKPP